MKRVWKSISGDTYTTEQVEQEIKKLDSSIQVHVGTDSQQDLLSTVFVTVIAIVTPGKGGRAFYVVDKVPRIRNLRERLLKEVWMSVNLAMEIAPMLDDTTRLQVHIDVNPNTDFRSSSYIKDLTALVVSQGFTCKTKPEAWAAMHVADHVVKYKVIDPS